jgi:YopX protein.
MSQKIKFRAWDKEEKEMIYDVQNTYDYTCNGSGAMEPSFKDVLEDKDRYEVMQFVNLCDFDGKELYTCDISIDEKGRIFVVYRGEGGFCMCLAKEFNWAVSNGVSPTQFKGLSDMNCGGGVFDKPRIIGNIYENPELIVEERY